MPFLPLPLHRILSSSQPLQKNNNPSPRTISLPPLSKGGGLTARHKLSLCCIFTCDTSAFFIHQLFAVKTEGLLYHPSLSPICRKTEGSPTDLSIPTTFSKAHPSPLPAPHSCLLMNVPLVLHPHCPLSPHQPFQNRTIPRLAPHSWLPCQRELDCDKAISYYKLQHSAISSTLIFAQPYLSQD